MIDRWFRRLGGRLGTGTRRASVLALVIAQIASLAIPSAGVSAADLVVDPEVRTLVSSGRARVLVMLEVADSSDEAQRSEAIDRAQNAVLARLPSSHASLLRRYTSIPVLALEIDATALLALEQMTDVVAAVKFDRPVRPQ